MTLDASLEQISALQVALTGEYGAIYAYGIIGANTQGADKDRALKALRSHELRRNQVRDQLVAAGADPVPAEAAYTMPNVVTNPESGATAAQTIELQLVGAWASLAARTPIEGQNIANRKLAVGASRECAVRAVAWGSSAQAFPG